MNRRNTKRFEREKYQIKIALPGNKEVLWIIFPYDKKFFHHLKEFTPAKWNATHEKWYLPDTAANRRLLGLEPKFVSLQAIKRIDDINRKALHKYM